MPTISDRIHNDLERDPPLFEAWKKGEGSYTIAEKYGTGIGARHLRRRFREIERRIGKYMGLKPKAIPPAKAAELARRASRFYWKDQGVRV